MTHLFSSYPRPLALIYGAAGFIGSHLFGLLLQSGWRVLGLDNLSSGRRDNLPEVSLVQGLAAKTAALRHAAPRL